MTRSIVIPLSMSLLLLIAHQGSDALARVERPAIIGIHTIQLLSGVEPADFEEFMLDEVFPVAAEVPGSVDRGGRSTIKSQHLLRNDGDEREYLWLIKYSGFLGAGQFRIIVGRMQETVSEKLKAFGTLKSSATHVVIDSLDVGPRDSLGRPTVSPTRGSAI